MVNDDGDLHLVALGHRGNGADGTGCFAPGLMEALICTELRGRQLTVFIVASARLCNKV